MIINAVLKIKKVARIVWLGFCFMVGVTGTAYIAIPVFDLAKTYWNAQ